MPTLLKYTLQISPNYGLILVYTHYFRYKYSFLHLIFNKAIKSLSNQFKSCSKIRQHSKKHVKHCFHILESTSIIVTSSKMFLKAGSKYYEHSLLVIVLGLFLLMNIKNLNL